MGWIGEEVKCDICTQGWVAVYREDTQKLECPNCGYFTQT